MREISCRREELQHRPEGVEPKVVAKDGKVSSQLFRYRVGERVEFNESEKVL